MERLDILQHIITFIGLMQYLAINCILYEAYSTVFPKYPFALRHESTILNASAVQIAKYCFDDLS
jgi:hypothetical protein